MTESRIIQWPLNAVMEEHDDTEEETVSERLTVERYRPRFPVLRWFVTDHLREGHLAEVSRECADLAAYAASNCVDHGADEEETRKGLDLLMAAKDHFVRAATMSRKMSRPGPGAGYGEENDG